MARAYDRSAHRQAGQRAHALSEVSRLEKVLATETDPWVRGDAVQDLAYWREMLSSPRYAHV